MSSRKTELPRPLDVRELIIGYACKRHLYFAYHGLLSGPGGKQTSGNPAVAENTVPGLEDWEDHERFLDRQRGRVRRAYDERKSTGANATVIEDPLLRVEVAELQREGNAVAATVVTSAASPKRSALLEAAAAYWILRGADAEVLITVRLVYLNRSYTPEAPDRELFITEDVTPHVAGMAQSMGPRLDALSDYLRQPRGVVEDDPARCDKPDRCPVCSDGLEASGEDDIFTLFRGRDKALPLYRRGIRRLTEIPKDSNLGRRQRIQIHSQRNGTIHLEPEALETFLSKLSFPLAFLDFEAVQEAVPRLPLSKPWQHLPFLFSLHRLEEPAGAEETFSGVLNHSSYLCRGGLESLEELSTQLVAALSGVQCILVYNREMESRSLSYLSRRFPALAGALVEAADRLVDLYPPFQAFTLYHPNQRGSVSLKRVLPALTDLDYGDVRFRDGRSASLAYYWAHLDDDGPLTKKDREWVDRELVSYCTLDTLGLAKLLEAMNGLLIRAQKKGPTHGAGPLSELSLSAE